jgi:HAD superfamily hydrolase (TIGR01490 family)
VSSVTSDVLALFDLDHTLLTRDSDEAWVEFLIERRALDRATFETANRALVARYQRGEAGVLEFTEFYLSTLASRDPEQLAQWRADYLVDKIFPAIPRAARQLVGRHQRDGHLCVLTTATNRFLTAPIAANLGFVNLIATDPEMRDGWYTGKVAGVANMRDGKVTRLEAWLALRRLQLGQFRESWFYSDSRNDIPLLSRVTHPVAVNADATLATLAVQRGWRTLTIAADACSG